MSDVHKEVLPNGLTILTEAMPAVRSISIGIWLRAGSRQERPSENGITHFLEHMLFKGTKNRSAEEIARAADSIGGHLDAYTAKECTSFSMKVLDEHLPLAVEILADLIKNPLLKAEDIVRERQVVQEEIKMVEDTPDDLVHEIFTQTYWRGHALGRPILGTRRTVGSFSRARLGDYFHRHYTPNNMVLAAAGHLEHARVVELVTKEFGDLRPGERSRPGRPPVAHPHITYRHKKTLEQVYLCLGMPAYSQTHKRRFACHILNTVLGGGMSSRLFQNIREKRGLAYAVFSGMNTFRDAGYLAVYAGTAPAHTRQVVELILAELCGLKTQFISEEEMRRAKDYLKGSLLLGLESTPSRMAHLARQQMYFDRCYSLDEIAHNVDVVTPEEVREVARECFAPRCLAVTVLGPLDGFKFHRTDLVC
jgi:predicted Zn-dependent peptidase